MEKYTFDQEDLSRHGVHFQTWKEGKLFSEIVKKDLERRIESKIRKKVDQKTLEDLYRCATKEESVAWLEQNCSDYRSIVRSEQEELACEMIYFRNEISGLLFDIDSEVLNLTIESLDMSNRSIHCLKYAGIYTVGDILTDWNLALIWNLEESLKREILLTVWEAIEPENLYPEDVLGDEEWFQIEEDTF